MTDFDSLFAASSSSQISSPTSSSSQTSGPTSSSSSSSSSTSSSSSSSLSSPSSSSSLSFPSTPPPLEQAPASSTTFASSSPTASSSSSSNKISPPTTDRAPSASSSTIANTYTYPAQTSSNTTTSSVSIPPPTASVSNTVSHPPLPHVQNSTSAPTLSLQSMTATNTSSSSSNVLATPPPSSSTAPVVNGVKGLKLVFGRLEFALDGQRLRIGRSEGVDILIKGDPLVSGSHCVITNGVLYDPSSTNGTFINGQKMPHKREIPLHGGDLIMVGETTLSVVGGPNPEHEKVLNEREAQEEPAGASFTRESVAVGPVPQPRNTTASSSSSSTQIAPGRMNDHHKEEEESSSDEEEGDKEEKEDPSALPSIISPTDNNPLAWHPGQRVKHKSFLEQPVMSPLNNDGVTQPFASNSNSDLNHYDPGASSLQGQDLQQELVDTKRALIKERTLNTQLKRKITHQGRKQNVEKHRNMMQNYESKIHSMEFQLLYGSTKKDEEIEQLKKQLKDMQEKHDELYMKSRSTEEVERLNGELAKMQEERNNFKEEVDSLENQMAEVENLKKQLEQSRREVKLLSEEQRNLQSKLLSSLSDSNLLMNKLLSRLDESDAPLPSSSSSSSSLSTSSVRHRTSSNSRGGIEGRERTGSGSRVTNARVIQALEDVRSSVKKFATTTTVVGVIIMCVALWTHYSSGRSLS